MRCRSVVFLGLCLLSAPHGVSAQRSGDAAAGRLHRLVIAEDYEAAIKAGRELMRHGAASPEAQAWTVVALSAYGMHDAALDAARAMRRRYPANSWAAYGYGVALLRVQDPTALQVVQRARAADPWNPLLVALQAEIDVSSTKGAGQAAALALLDSAGTRSKADRALWLARAQVEMISSNMDLAAFQRADAAASEALQLDSADVGAWGWKREAATRLGSSDQALEAAKRAVAAAPSSVRPHEMLWAATRQRRDLTPEQAREEILREVTSITSVRGRTPGLLYKLSGLYGDLAMPARRAAVQAELRRDYPRSFEVETLDFDTIKRLRVALRRPRPDSAAAKAEFGHRLATFVATPGRSRRALEQAYGFMLEAMLADTTTPSADLARAADGVVRYRRGAGPGDLWTTALRLAEHPETRGLAERAARRIPAEAEAMMGGNMFQVTPGARVGGSGASAQDRRQMEETLRRSALTRMHDALGWIRFNDGRLTAARAELDTARSLSPGNPLVLYHLGRVAERRGQQTQAEWTYLRGVALESPSGDQPNRSALRRLFAMRDSTPGALDSLLARRAAQARQAMRDTVLARRVKQPRVMPAFSLPRIEGGTFSSADLSGKVAFVNFWGTWCAPCVDEMKHIQRLYERYHDDPDVALVTIGVEMDSANARELLSTALKVRKLSFPVLIGNGRMRTMVGGFPTTWYVDRQGRIAFIEEISYYGEYVDELDPFVWRIEDLKTTAAPPR